MFSSEEKASFNVSLWRTLQNSPYPPETNRELVPPIVTIIPLEISARGKIFTGENVNHANLIYTHPRHYILAHSHSSSIQPAARERKSWKPGDWLIGPRSHPKNSARATLTVCMRGR